MDDQQMRDAFQVAWNELAGWHPDAESVSWPQDMDGDVYPIGKHREWRFFKKGVGLIDAAVKEERDRVHRMLIYDWQEQYGSVPGDMPVCEAGNWLVSRATWWDHLEEAFRARGGSDEVDK